MSDPAELRAFRYEADEAFAEELADMEVPESRFGFLLPDDSIVRGVVQGSAGIISMRFALEEEIRRARRAKRLSVRDPQAGCVRVFEHYTTADSGPATIVDLRTARLLP